MCNVQTLITNGIVHLGEDLPEESLSSEYVLRLLSSSLNFDCSFMTWPGAGAGLNTVYFGDC